MTQILGACQMGFVYGLLALGVYITFRILNTPDLTADGSFTLGMAVCAMVSGATMPFLGLLAAFLCGLVAGAITGLLQTKAGIHPILAGILTMSGLYSVNMFVMGGSPNVNLTTTLFKQAHKLIDGIDRTGKNVVTLIIAGVFTLAVTAVLIWLFKTHIGLCIRATGNNAEMVKASSINAGRMKVLALSLANGLVALSGAMNAQMQGFADVNGGTGMVVVGIASVIIGELFTGRRGVTVGLISALIGSIVYRLIYAMAINYTALPAYALKLVSALIVVLALAIPTAIKNMKAQAAQRRANHA
ncbi:MAG: ABC transporter permease [Clostridia bacterium]|nr:ABC transporter permease [Clostridia bacterium]